jgi:hypothetical protein
MKVAINFPRVSGVTGALGRVGRAALGERSMSRTERLIALALFLLLAAALSNFEAASIWLHNLDTAFLLESMRAVNQVGEPLTRLGPAFLDAYEAFYLPAAEMCRASLQPGGKALSILTSHAYYMVYPLAWLTRWFSAEWVLGVANGTAFIGYIYVLYLVLRREGASLLGALAFCALATAHPAWAFGALGDVYFDRFFLPLGLLFAAQLYWLVTGARAPSRGALAGLFAVAVVAVSTTERAAIMMGYMTAVFLALYWRTTPPRLRAILAGFCCVLVVYVLAWMLLVYAPHRATPSQGFFLRNVVHTLSLLATPAYLAQVIEFLVVNVALFGLFALVNWRLALIMVAALLPNFLVTMGGAEKNGWMTHYHSAYFPFVTFAAAAGLGQLWRRLRAWRPRLVLLAMTLVLHPLLSNASPGYRGQAGIVQRGYQFYRLGPAASERSRVRQLVDTARAVPPGAKVTTIEGFMPSLEEGRTLYYYPVGLDSADYAVLTRVERPDGTSYIAGAISYRGESAQADACLTDQLRKQGYDVDKPKATIGPIVVLSRTAR